MELLRSGCNLWGLEHGPEGNQGARTSGSLRTMGPVASKPAPLLIVPRLCASRSTEMVRSSVPWHHQRSSGADQDNQHVPAHRLLLRGAQSWMTTVGSGTAFWGSGRLTQRWAQRTLRHPGKHLSRHDRQAAVRALICACYHFATQLLGTKENRATLNGVALFIVCRACSTVGGGSPLPSLMAAKG